jgi:hypothetical protein
MSRGVNAIRPADPREGNPPDAYGRPGERRRLAPDRVDHVEDRQVHGDDHAADDHAEEHDHDGFERGERCLDRGIDFLVVEVGDPGSISSSPPVCSPTLIIWTTMGGKTPDFLSGSLMVRRRRCWCGTP